jgi:hypothetical protein
LPLKEFFQKGVIHGSDRQTFITNAGKKCQIKGKSLQVAASFGVRGCRHVI